jgi:hypothetical protein
MSEDYNLWFLSREEKMNNSRNEGNTPTPHGSIFSSSLNKLVGAEAMAPEEAAVSTQMLWSPSPDGGAATSTKDVAVAYSWLWLSELGSSSSQAVVLVSWKNFKLFLQLSLLERLREKGLGPKLLLLLAREK